MIALACKDMRLVLDPATGGAISRLEFAGFSVLRPVCDPRLAAQHGRAVAGYPLLPYANRVAFGRFGFGGEAFQLDRNFGDHPHSIHGNGWMRAWHVAQQDAVSARLVLAHQPPDDPVGDWPFRYRAAMDFRVGADTVEIGMSIRNTDDRPWPAGMGFHPYVARGAGTRLRFDADTVWRNGADGLPADRIAVAGPWDFTEGRALGETLIDECYAGWGGGATVTWPDEGIALTLQATPPFDHVQLYTPPGRDFFGLEPVSNMPDSVNRMAGVADAGLKVLAPGETLSGAVTCTVARMKSGTF